MRNDICEGRKRKHCALYKPNVLDVIVFTGSVGYSGT